MGDERSLIKWQQNKRNTTLLKTLLPSSNGEILAWVSRGLCPDIIVNATEIKQWDK